VVLVALATSIDAVVTWRRIDRVSLHPTGSPPGGTTYLLVGTDSRAFVRSKSDAVRYGTAADTPGERADVVLALRVRDDGRIALLKLSRDLLVLGPAGSPARLTTTLLSGRDALLQSLCRSLGLGVDHYLQVRFPGLRSIIDSLGGIEVHAATRVRDLESGLHLRAGANRLDGDGALEYVGARHVEVWRNGRWVADDGSEGNRSGRAAEVLTIVGRELGLSPLHPVSSVQRAWALAGAVAVDDELGLSDAWDVRGALGLLAGSKEVALPVTSTAGPVPVDQVAPGAGKVLSQFDGPGRSRRCTAHLPAAADRR
jgi:LCP family protein required for cell wall assembly